jgi:hypothetical protein
MDEKKQIEFKVLRKNSCGHRFILEPKERIKFREKCKHNRYGTLCDKGYRCYSDGACLIGCTPNVNCPRVGSWDKRHGLEGSYTMEENLYPDMKPTTFMWHPATESPGKRRILLAVRVKGHEHEYMLMRVVRFCAPNTTPATCIFKNEDGVKELPIAWAYYDEIIKGIADWMVDRAESAAWAWWPDGKEEDEKGE